MKKIVYGLLLISLAFSNVMAADSLKIGVVSVAKISSEAPQLEALKTAMIERFGGKKEELDVLKKEFITMQENYKRNELVMTEDKLNELKSRIIGKMQAFKQKEAMLNQEVSTMQSQELAKLQQTMVEIIQGIAKSGKYDLVLGEGVIYMSDSLDITDKVLDEMKKSFKQDKK